MSTVRGSHGVRKKAARRIRLSPEERRRRLVRVAARLMSRRGVNAVQFGEVAAAGGVTRQLVYKLFARRHDLIAAVLEEHVRELGERFGRGVAQALPGSVEEASRVFVEAVCDTIELHGAGPWRLLDARGPDPQIARIAARLQDRLTAPWIARIAQALRIEEREAATVLRMIVAAGRAVLELWYDGALSREEAVRDTTRGVSALLEAFSARPRRAGTRRR